MLPATITLTCDPLGTGNIERVFEIHETAGDVSIYRGPSHQTNVFTDTLTCRRYIPKIAGDFLGQCKGSAKISRTYAVNNVTDEPIKRPGFVEVSVSLPNGVSEDDAKTIVAQAATAALQEFFLDLTLRQELA